VYGKVFDEIKCVIGLWNEIHCSVNFNKHRCVDVNNKSTVLVQITLKYHDCARQHSMCLCKNAYNKLQNKFFIAYEILKFEVKISRLYCHLHYGGTRMSAALLFFE